MSSARNTGSSSDRRLIGPLAGLLVFALLLIPCRGLAQTAQGLQLDPTTGLRLDAPPGGVATGAVRITSMLDYEVRGIAMIDLPAGWRPLVGEGGFDIHPGAEDTRLFSFSVPRGTPAGIYDVVYSLRSGDTGVEFHNVRFSVHVLARLGLDVRLVHGPRSVVAGRPYTATFELTNTSNKQSRILFEIRSVPSLETVVDTSTLVLASGESRELPVTVQTEAGINRSFRHVVELRAWLQADRTKQGQASALVEVMPMTSFESDQVVIPLQFTFRNTGENNRSGSQGELYGTGSFSGSGTDRYELLIRGPDNRTQSLLGRRDEYRALYQSREFDLIVGDQAFRMTPLTELGRYAFGANTRVSIDRFTVGAFLNRARWSPARPKQAAGYASYTVARDAIVGVNFLHKEDGVASDILSAQAQIGLLDLADLAVELGGSTSEGTRDAGYALQLASRPGRLQYGVHLIHAEPNFAGYYRNFDAKAFNVSVYPVDQFRVEGYYRNERRGLDLDPALLHAPENTTIQAGVGFGTYVAAYYKMARQRDLLPQPKYDQEDRTLVLRLGAPYRNGAVYASIDVGTTEELLLQKSYPLTRFSLAARFQPDPDQGYHVSLEYSSTKDLFTDLSREGVSWNISAWFHIAPPLLFQAGLYESWTIAPTRQQNRIADATLEYTFPFQHRISVMGRINQITSGFDRRNVAYNIEYTIPFDLSFTSTPDGGSVDGRVIDEATGRGIASVIIHAGEQVSVTDDDGYFEFPNLREGTHAITLDRGILGPDRIASQLLPNDVQIAVGVKRHLEIGITTSGSISGSVVRLASDDGRQGTPVGLQGILVEISSGTEVFRRVTDGRGLFHFGDLRPGTWQVGIVEDEIPGDLRAGAPGKTIVVNPGLDAQTRLDLAPVRKRVRLLQEGTLLRPE